MKVYCTQCGDEYEPVEYRPVVDPDEPHFCSDECEDSYWDDQEIDRITKIA